MERISDATLNGRARYAGRRIGLVVRKRRRAGYYLIEPSIGGIAYDLSAQEVIDYCKGFEFGRALRECRGTATMTHRLTCQTTVRR